MSESTSTTVSDITLYDLVHQGCSFSTIQKKQITYHKTETPGSTRLSFFEVIDECDVTTLINGVVETTQKAKPNDYIITGPACEQYVLSKEKFNKNYDLDGDTATTKQVIRFATTYNGPDTTLVASWGERMVVNSGDAIVIDTADITEARNMVAAAATEHNPNHYTYSIEQSVFEETYSLV